MLLAWEAASAFKAKLSEIYTTGVCDVHEKERRGGGLWRWDGHSVWGAGL